MPVTIKTKYSTSANTAPSAGQLTLGELAINVTDKKIYALNASNNVVLLAQSPPTLTTVNTTGAATFTSNVLNIPQYQGAVTLTTTGTSGATTFTSNTLNVPQYQGAITFTTTNTTGAATFSANALNIPQYQGQISLTTTGTAGGATFSSNTLNIPQYQGALTVTSSGTSGAATLVGSTLNIPQYSGAPGGITLTTTGTSGVATLSAGNLNIPDYGSGSPPAATATTLGSVYGSTISGNSNISFGYNSVATNTSIAIGATGNNQSIAIGGTGLFGVSIGFNTVGAGGVNIGNDSKTTNGVSIGTQAITDTASFAIAIGNAAESVYDYDIAIGEATYAYSGGGSGGTNPSSIAIGPNIETAYDNKIIIGKNTIATTNTPTGTIALLASATAATITTAGVFIDSVRTAASGAPNRTLMYNTTTKELSYGQGSQRVLASTANSATPTLNTDNYDMMVITGQSVAITSFTTNLTGTPVNGQRLWIAITGTTAIAITWGASFESSNITLPATTVTTNRLDIGFVWNAATSKWRCIAFA